MNQKDLKIISHLRNNARMSLTMMSKKTSIPISTLFDKIKLFQEDIIKKHTSLLDFNKLGYSTRATILLSVEKEDKENLKLYLQHHQSVNSVYKITNGYDFMIEAVFSQILQMEEFLDTVESKFSVKDKKSFFIIDDIKREEFLADENLFAL